MSDARFACALSTESDAAAAQREAAGELLRGLGGRRPDLVAVFATHHLGPALEELGPYLREALSADVVVGCTGERVIGRDREVETGAGLALFGAALPGTEVKPFTLEAEPDGGGEPDVRDPARSSILLMGDPYTFHADAFLKHANATWPGMPVMGGMASGGHGPGQNLLITGEGLREGGAVGVVLEGDVGLHPVVSQGCRPVGKPWVITACEQNVVVKLGGEPAIEALRATLTALPSGERELLMRGPMVGLALDPAKSTFQRGDFLVRGLQGQGPGGSLVVGDLVRRGQTIQFLLRDAPSASEDLKLLMSDRAGGPLPQGSDPAVAGALLFSCNGRGAHMFGEADHDVTHVRRGLGADVPVAGFFAAGEIGPVSGRNFLHGFTASVAVFRPRPSGL